MHHVSLPPIVLDELSAQLSGDAGHREELIVVGSTDQQRPSPPPSVSGLAGLETESSRTEPTGGAQTPARPDDGQVACFVDVASDTGVSPRTQMNAYVQKCLAVRPEPEPKHSDATAQPQLSSVRPSELPALETDQPKHTLDT